MEDGQRRRQGAGCARTGTDTAVGGQTGSIACRLTVPPPWSQRPSEPGDSAVTHGEHRAERQLYGQEDGSARGASPQAWAWRLLSWVILGDAAAGRLTGAITRVTAPDAGTERDSRPPGGAGRRGHGRRAGWTRAAQVTCRRRRHGLGPSLSHGNRTAGRGRRAPPVDAARGLFPRGHESRPPCHALFPVTSTRSHPRCRAARGSQSQTGSGSRHRVDASVARVRGSGFGVAGVVTPHHSSWVQVSFRPPADGRRIASHLGGVHEQRPPPSRLGAAFLHLLGELHVTVSSCAGSGCREPVVAHQTHLRAKAGQNSRPYGKPRRERRSAPPGRRAGPQACPRGSDLAAQSGVHSPRSFLHGAD